MAKPPEPPTGQIKPRIWFGFRRFQTRLLAVMMLLVMGLQALLFITIHSAATRNAEQECEIALQLTTRTLQTIMATRESTLRKYARLLTSDYAFKNLVGTGDSATILSGFQSYLRRLNADSMVLLDMDGKVIGDTMARLQPDYGNLIRAAQVHPDNESSGIVRFGAAAYQMVLVPLNAPHQVAWVGIGFSITDSLAQELEQQTHTQVSLVQHPKVEGQKLQLLASTLNGRQRSDFITHVQTNATHLYRMPILGSDYVTLALPLDRISSGSNNAVVSAVLQRSLDEALSNFRTLRLQLFAVFIFSSLLAIFVGSVIARRVTRPLQQLAHSAEKIRAGQYELVDNSKHNDEFAELGQTFNNMVHGLIERDKVRSLLGKVVSPAVAQELLSRKIELGGEEREVSILFSDIRGFTTLAEGHAPGEILTMLNTYFSVMSDIIDNHQGVVDKYIGDAIMALFGAPISAPDDPERCLNSALGMMQALAALNQTLTQQGWPALKTGIGIHTGIVVAGNIGSNSRLNYTVLGDNVNLAARLESLCKKYQVEVIVSEATVLRCPQFTFRELDRVRVKGKRQAVSIFQLLAPIDQLSEAQQTWLTRHAEALATWRRGEFDKALACFTALPQDAVSEMYRERCTRFIKNPPPPDWDAIETLDEK
jgi:adenylate cyclase